MATTRAIVHFIRRRHILPCTSSAISSSKNIFYYPLYTSRITFADQKAISKSEQNESGGQVQVGFAETVKETTKSAWYLSVIIAGVGVTAVMFYTIFRELFSSKSPNGVYSEVLKRIENDPRVTDVVGLPIKAHGEETRRGRRGHVSHTLYEKNGVPHMRMQFYIHGAHKEGTVFLEVREDSSGKWIYRYLFVQLKDRPRTVIVLEDNRETENIVYQKAEDTHELLPPGYNFKMPLSPSQ